MQWIALIVVAFFVGLSPLRPWSMFVLPAASVALAALVVANEPDTYDMPDLIHVIGLVSAFICVGTWLAGRGVRGLVRRGHSK